MVDNERFVRSGEDVVMEGAIPPDSLRVVDGHRSAIERFTDVGFEPVAWDANMAMRLAGVDPKWPRDRQLERLQDAVNNGDLPDEAVERLIDAGFPELG